MENKNYIYNIQVNILFNKEDNQHFSFYKEEIQNMLEAFNRDIFKKVNEKMIYFESCGTTINVLGEFDPYHYDRLKNSDSLMEYDSTYKWVKGEVSKNVKEKFKGLNLKCYVGFTKFEELI